MAKAALSRTEVALRVRGILADVGCLAWPPSYFAPMWRCMMALSDLALVMERINDSFGIELDRSLLKTETTVGELIALVEGAASARED